MFAVVEAGGRQLQVSPSDIIRIDRIEAEAGSEVTLGKVLLLRTDDQTHVGLPAVAGAEVRAEVIGEQKGDKIRVFFYRRRKNNKKTRGHRQRYTAVRVSSILLNGEVIAEKKKDEAPKGAAKAETKKDEAPKGEAKAAADA